ncbi:thioredoxin fold domain-containing protein [Chryseobacterium sp.]|uniref:TlpA family protein disulfide reductase n=1 Tax=Chryseobacterium sp. TaxID=1871047 RepID=UPI00261920C9|nr:thioredoxin fold domain-containing protein [Chryseobacterium sp.]
MKKKKFLKVLAAVIPVLAIGLVVYLFLNFQKRREKAEALKYIPSFHLSTIDGNTFTQENLAHGQTKIIIYFSPGCHFCHAEAKELSKNKHTAKDIQWIWVASEPLNEIKEFAVKYKLDQQTDIFWCHDEMAILYQKLAISSVPYFLIYDKKNHLIKRNPGAIKLDKLINSFDERK